MNLLNQGAPVLPMKINSTSDNTISGKLLKKFAKKTHQQRRSIPRYSTHYQPLTLPPLLYVCILRMCAVFSSLTPACLKVTIIYGDNILRIGGIAHFARIKFCAYVACASGVALLFHAHARALVRQWYIYTRTIVHTRCAYHLRTSAL